MDFGGVSDDWQSSDEATFREFYVASKELPASVETHILKTGEHIVINEPDAEVLYTFKDAQEPITNFNDNSAVLMFNCLGTRILFGGGRGSRGEQISAQSARKAPLRHCAGRAPRLFRRE